MIIDVTRLLHRTLKERLPTGVDRVNLAYVEHFYSKARALATFGGRWMIFDKSASNALFDNLLLPKSRTALGIAIASALTSGRANPRTKILLNVGHLGLERPGYTAKAKRLGLKPFYFLHDLIPITHPEYSKAGETELHRTRMAEMMGSCGLILNSAVTQSILNYYAAQIEAHIPPCVIAPVAPARLPPPSPRRTVEGAYFVMLGTIEPRKNHLNILQVWRRIIEQCGPSAPKLFIIGQRGRDCAQVANVLDHCEPLRGTVIEVPKCLDADLSTYLHYAKALLFPSFEEGYGMPLVEALAAGTPVIASNLPVFREIAGDIPKYLDPLDGCGWLDTVLAYTSFDSAARARQLTKIKGFQIPTWQDHFTKVESFLRQTAAST